MSRTYIEGLEWIISQRSTLPAPAERVCGQTPQSIWQALILGEWETPDSFEDHVEMLSELPESFPYRSIVEPDGTWTFIRKDKPT